MFILASASPRRLELLAQMAIKPDAVIAAEIDETPKKAELPRDYVTRMAQEKAAKIGAQHPDDVVLAADTIVACGRRILGKPSHQADALKMLRLLSGRRHRVYSSICLVKAGKAHHKTVLTQVQFKRLSDEEIQHYISSNEWEGKAGAYAIQGRAAAFIPAINGSYTNVVGLPLAETAALLKAWSPLNLA